jgi:AraC family transcriptional regulator
MFLGEDCLFGTFLNNRSVKGIMGSEVTAIGLTRQFATSDLAVALYHQQPLSHLPKHAHPGCSICFVLRGDYQESCGGTARDFREGDLIVKAAATIHEDRFGNGGADCLLVELSPQMVQSTGISSLSGLSGAYRRLSLIKLGMRISRELLLRDAITPLALEALTLEVIVDLLRSTPRVQLQPPAWLRRVREILESSLTRQTTLQSIANEAGVHPGHLSRVFRRHYGCSVGDFLRNQQVVAAANRLRESDDSLASIAYSLGFADQSHFTRVFRQFKGTTPRQYRLSSRKT